MDPSAGMFFQALERGDAAGVGMPMEFYRLRDVCLRRMIEDRLMMKDLLDTVARITDLGDKHATQLHIAAEDIRARLKLYSRSMDFFDGDMIEKYRKKRVEEDHDKEKLGLRSQDSVNYVFKRNSN